MIYSKKQIPDIPLYARNYFIAILLITALVFSGCSDSGSSSDSGSDTNGVTDSGTPIAGIQVRLGSKVIGTGASLDLDTFGILGLDSHSGMIAEFEVKNTGNTTITFGNEITLSGTHASEFQVKTQPAASLAAGNATSFSIALAPESTGDKTTTATLVFDDSKTFTMTLNGSCADSTDTGVFVRPQQDGAFDFGTKLIDTLPESDECLSFYFEIKNTGSSDIFFTGTPMAKISGTGFSVTDQPDSNRFLAGETQSCTLALDTSTAGEKSSIVSISLGFEEDSPCLTYTFEVTGKINPWRYLGDTNMVTMPDQDIELKLSRHKVIGYEREDIELAVHKGIPYVAFIENDDTGGVSVISFKEDQWAYTGTQGEARPEEGNTVEWLAMDIFDQEGTAVPYVAYAEHNQADDGRTTVERFNVDNWEAVGNRRFTANDKSDAAPANLGNGTDFTGLFVNNEEGLPVPYIAVQQKIAGNCNSSVYKYDNTAPDKWSLIGTPGIANGLGSALRIFVLNGETPVPYVANAESGTVRAYENGNWNLIGDENPFGRIFDIFVHNDNGTPVPYVAHTGGVSAYIDNSWQTVGTNSPGEDISSISMKVRVDDNGNAVPYIAIVAPGEKEHSTGITVFKLSGDTWETLLFKDIGIDLMGRLHQVRLALDTSGETPIPYIAFLAWDESECLSNDFSDGISRLYVMKYDHP